jgi:hypothetical protein
MKFNPIPGTTVLVGIWDVRVRDYAVFANKTNMEWARPKFNQTDYDPAVNLSWNDSSWRVVGLLRGLLKRGQKPPAPMAERIAKSSA